MFNIEETIGTPYEEMNCIKYVSYVYKQIHGKDMYLFFNPDEFKDNIKERIKLFKEHKDLASYLKEPKEDCLVFFGSNIIYHIGYFKNGLIYHSIEDLGVVAETLEQLKKRYKTIQFVEYKNE